MARMTLIIFKLLSLSLSVSQSAKFRNYLYHCGAIFALRNGLPGALFTFIMAFFFIIIICNIMTLLSVLFHRYTRRCVKLTRFRNAPGCADCLKPVQNHANSLADGTETDLDVLTSYLILANAPSAPQISLP